MFRSTKSYPALKASPASSHAAIPNGDAPIVIAQLGQTLDGRIATVTGESRDINGAGGLDHLHRLRAAVDAVIIGVGTVIADNPLLTVRRADGPDPVRVIVDPNGRLPSDAAVLADDDVRRIVIRGADGPDCPLAETLRLPVSDGEIPPRSILEALAAQGLHRVLVEGGGRTISRFVEAGLIDRLHLIVAPMIIGSGQPGLDLAPVASLRDALRPDMAVYSLDGGDVLFDCRLRDKEAGRLGQT